MPNPTYIPFPPGGTQIAQGSGNLTGVANDLPNNPKSIGGYFEGPLQCSIYDTANGAVLSTPLLVINDPSGAGPGTLDIPFTHGLYVVQTTQSSIKFTFN